jgi:ferredoxin-NADP reductase
MRGIEASPNTIVVSRRLEWQTAEVAEIVDETPRTRSLVLNLPGWPGHKPGQHIDIRLTGEDGYQAQRSYSIASAPESPRVAVTVERIDDGEVSPYLTSVVQPGDKFEIRGPIGGYFVWTVSLRGPLFLIAGGSGIAPLMAMLRHRAALGSRVPTLLIYSSRSHEDIIYREELERLAAADDQLMVSHTLTRRQPVGWTGGARRIDREMLASLGMAAVSRPRVFICGPTQLVETAAASLIELGHEARLVKTERFGPTGA